MLSDGRRRRQSPLLHRNTHIETPGSETWRGTQNLISIIDKLHTYCRFCLVLLTLLVDLHHAKQVDVNKIKESTVYNYKVQFEPQSFLQSLDQIASDDKSFDIKNFIQNLNTIGDLKPQDKNSPTLVDDPPATELSPVGPTTSPSVSTPVVSLTTDLADESSSASTSPPSTELPVMASSPSAPPPIVSPLSTELPAEVSSIFSAPESPTEVSVAGEAASAESVERQYPTSRPAFSPGHLNFITFPRHIFPAQKFPRQNFLKTNFPAVSYPTQNFPATCKCSNFVVPLALYDPRTGYRLTPVTLLRYNPNLVKQWRP